MKCTHLLSLICLPIVCATVSAQSGEASKTTPAKVVAVNTQSATDAEAERLLVVLLLRWSLRGLCRRGLRANGAAGTGK